MEKRIQSIKAEKIRVPNPFLNAKENNDGFSKPMLLKFILSLILYSTSVISDKEWIWITITTTESDLFLNLES